MYFPLLVCLPGGNDMDLASVTATVTARLAPFDKDNTPDRPYPIYEAVDPWHYSGIRLLRDVKALTPQQAESRTLTWEAILDAEQRFDPVGASLEDRLQLDEHGRAYRLRCANPVGYFDFWSLGDAPDHPAFQLRRGATGIASCQPACADRHPACADIAVVAEIDLEKSAFQLTREIRAAFVDAARRIAVLPIAEPLTAILHRHKCDGAGVDAAVAEYLAQPARRALVGHTLSELGDPIAILDAGLDALLTARGAFAALVGDDLVDLDGVWRRSPVHELSEHPADRIVLADHRHGLAAYLADVPASTVLVQAYCHR